MKEILNLGGEFGLPLYELDGPTCPMGFDMNQNRLAVPVWSYAIETLKPRRIVEIGSYNGGFTMALAFAGWTKGVEVFSYELGEAPKEEWREMARFLKVQFLRGNCFACEEEIRQLLGQPGRSFLLCDGGDKVKEFNTFAKYLKAGDLIAAHDCGTPYWPWSEFDPKRVSETVSELCLYPWRPHLFELCGWCAALKDSPCLPV
jgi:cephalosporin hydroxylase